MDGKESEVKIGKPACVKREPKKEEPSRSSELLWIYIVRVPAPAPARLPLPGLPCTHASLTLTDGMKHNSDPKRRLCILPIHITIRGWSSCDGNGIRIPRWRLSSLS